MVKVESRRGVEDILLEEGILTQEQVASIKFEYVNSGTPVDTIIKSRGLVTQTQLAQAYAKLIKIPFTKIFSVSIPAEVLELVPEQVAKTYKLIPFEKSGNSVKVAMADPLDLQVIEFLEKRSSCKIIPYMATGEDIMSAIGDQYGKSIGTEVSEALEAVGATTKIKEQIKDMSKAVETLRDAPVARIVATLLEYAAKARASDLHIEPSEDKTRVRYRIDGILQERLTLPKKVHPSVVSRIKILADLKIDERRVPQDGRFKIDVGGTHIDLRVSSLPTIFGEKIVIRLLKESDEALKLSDLGLGGVSLRRVQDAMTRPTGIILVAGPTGCGKTLTLASILRKISTPAVNTITLEDPVEIRILGVNQVQVNPPAGLTFASGLRSFLRQDPDIIMVGEIRDGETAELAIHASLTGHLVLSTLHTNSAAGAPPRLLDMGVEAFLLISTLNAVIAQRLVRRICKHCAADIEASAEAVEQLKKVLGPLFDQKLKALKKDPSGKIILRKGVGCDKCSNSGFSGRIGIFEVLVVDSAISNLVIEHRPAAEIEKQAVASGLITMAQDGCMKVLDGVTTLEEVIRVISTS